MNKIKYHLINFLDENPRVSSVVRTQYGRVLRQYIQLYTKMQNAIYSAPLDPFILHWISPDKIVHEVDCQFWFQSTTKVKSGDWDLKTSRFENHYFYQSFINHFENGVPWENTKLYEKKTVQMREGKISKYRYGETKEDILRRLEKIDELYNSIKIQGYQTQRALRDKSLGGERTHLPPELFEIAVNIGRNGDWLFDDGRHRLIIAKMLDIDAVPVRILVRHQQWQEFRDQVYLGSVDSNYTHPDIPIDGKQ